MDATVKTDAWWCSHCWDRHELPAGGDRRRRKPCPDCGEKLHRVSRYEWFLEDALNAALEAAGADHRIRPQFPVEDHRGFTWYWDLGVWVNGGSAFNGYGLLIDVNGRDHLEQRHYTGAGGGYTRDYDKVWELGQQQWHKRGWDHWIVPNDLCRRAGNVVHVTAQEIVTHMLGRAQTQC